MEKIFEIQVEDHLKIIQNIIQKSFMTVAKQFNLTPENAPTNPAFIQKSQLLFLQKKSKCFLFYKNKHTVSFFAIEIADNNVYYLEKICILPSEQKKGYGEKMVPELGF